MTMENELKIFFESKQRMKWFIDGIGLHGLSADLFSKISTPRICELYNIQLTYFEENETKRK